MAAQLTLDMPPSAVREPLLPADHPVAVEAVSGDWPPDFMGMAERYDQAVIDLCVRTFNAIGGAQIRWDETTREFCTRDGDRYPRGTVEDVVRGLMRGQAA